MAYDNSNVDITAGGYGYAPSNGPASGGDITVANTQYRFDFTGTLTEFKMRLNSVSGTPVTEAHLFIMSGAGAGSFVTVQDVNVVDAMNEDWVAAGETTGRFTVDLTGLSIPVAAGQFIAVYVSAEFGPSINITSPVSERYQTAGSDPTFMVQSTDADLFWEAKVSSNLAITYDDSTGYGDGDILYTPYYDDQPQYIILEDVDVPDAEDLEIALYYTDATTGVNTVAKTLSINFDGGANDAKISLDGFTNSQSIAGQEGNKFNIHIWLDPITDKIQVIYVNTEVGQGPSTNAGDIRHIALDVGGSTARTPGSLTANIKIRRIALTQNTGSAASVGQVWVCRKPVLSIGDSIATAGRVGGYLDDVFTEPRVVIIGAVGSSSVMRSNTLATNVRQRWDAGANPGDDNTLQDLIEYRDVICAFVNGPGVNDIMTYARATSTDNDLLGLGGQVGGAVFNMASTAISTDLYSGDPDNDSKVSNDTVLCEMIPKNTEAVSGSLPNERLTQTYVNDQLAYASYELQIPLALTYDNYPGGYDDAVHPNAAGAEWIADQIAEAYEENKIQTASDIASSVGVSGGGYRSRYSG